MATVPEEFRFGNFLASIIWVILIVIVVLTLVILPLTFIVLFYVPLPPVNGEVLTPYLFLSMVVDPTRTLPIVKYLIHTTPFKVIVFPGFVFAAIIAAATIFVERKFLAKMQLRVGPLYAGVWGVGEGILQLAADGLKVISKEILIPSGADKPIFWAAPIAFVATADSSRSIDPCCSWLGSFEYKCRTSRCIRNTRILSINCFAVLLGK